MEPIRNIVSYEAARLREAVPKWNQMWKQAPLERRGALDEAFIYTAHGIAGPYIHQRCAPSFEVTSALILGTKPQELAPELTRREASQWARQNEHETPLQWLTAQVADKHSITLESTPRTVAVVRWLDEILSDPPRREAALRTRTGMIMGHEVSGRVVDRLDELTPKDLTGSPVETVERAARRIAETAWKGPNELAPEMPWHKKLPNTVTVLRTYSDLYTEGRECAHCVVAYAQRVHSQECTILRVLAPDGTRSTVEVVNKRVTQHLGPRNTEPSEACKAIVKSLKM